MNYLNQNKSYNEKELNQSRSSYHNPTLMFFFSILLDLVKANQVYDLSPITQKSTSTTFFIYCFVHETQFSIL